jgi:hypothetical protein
MIPLVTVMHGTKFPEHPALPLTPEDDPLVAAVMTPSTTVMQAGSPLHPNVPLTVDGVRLVDEPQPQVALEGIITKRARPD